MCETFVIFKVPRKRVFTEQINDKVQSRFDVVASTFIEPFTGVDRGEHQVACKHTKIALTNMNPIVISISF